MSEKVLSFNKDDKFYFKKANEFLSNNQFVLAIRFLNKAIDLSQNKAPFLKCSYYLVLAQAYSAVKLYELSNIYYYKALENDIFAQLVFRGLGENFYLIGNVNASKFYLNQCVNLLETSQVATSAKAKLYDIEKNEKPLFRVVSSEEGLSLEEQNKVEKLISLGKFNQVINLMETKNNFSNSKLRAELALAYFFTGQTQKGINLINKFGNGSLTDLCNLLLMYYNKNDSKNYNKVREKLLNFSVEDDEQLFKIGLTLAQTEDYIKAKEFMEVFLEKNPYEWELKFMYAITCINCNRKDVAKNILLDLKTLDPYNNYIINYYLDICNKDDTNKLQYIFNLPISEYTKVQNKVKEFLFLSNEELLKAFNNNEDLFCFLANNEETNLVKLLFIKLSLIEDQNIKSFFDYCLLTENLKEKTKNEIVVNILSQDGATNVSVVKNKIFTKIVVPNVLATKANNPNIFEALQHVIKFMLSEALLMNINLKREIIKIERIIKQEKTNPSVLATFICFDYLQNKKKVSLNKICKFFNVSQQDFYKFLEEYNIEI